jgi:hypothetical protein
VNKCKYHFKYIHTNFSEHHIKTYVLTYIISMIILGGGGGLGYLFKSKGHVYMCWGLESNSFH